jgi:hypothetical protein
MVVDEISGCIDGFPKLGLACDHFHTNKFSSPEDQNFCHIAAQIKTMVESAPERIKERLNRKAPQFSSRFCAQS